MIKNMNVQTLKGFRDFLPEAARKRQYVLDTLKKVFESYGFEPLETPALEYEEILAGKYGEEGDKLMYRFEDNGKRKVAMRYDQTVPLARVITEYQNDLPMPFKRYQIQNVWRADNTQKGRYREFLQVDADIVGAYSPLADAEIISLTAKSLEKLGFKNFKILINDRSILSKFSKEAIIAIDKIKKIGREGVLKEIVEKGTEKDWKKVDDLITNIENEGPSDKILEVLRILKSEGISNDKIKFESTLARGLDYYTGLIIEVEVEGYNTGSIAGGGRYDNLIGMFAGRDIPAVGFAFGFDRLMEAMEVLGLFPKDQRMKDVFVAFANSDLQEKALEITQKLRNKNINAEYYLEDANLEKQLKYADKKQITYSVIVSDKELLLKDMEKRTQEALSFEEIVKKLNE